MTRNIVVAITGASGSAYAVRLVEVLLDAGCTVHLTISEAAQAVIRQELGLAPDLENFEPQEWLAQLAPGPDDRTPDVDLWSADRSAAPLDAGSGKSGRSGRIGYHHFRDLMAPIASGSFLTDGMVVCPCSMGTLSAIVHGTSANLIHRAADVHLKERRPLVLVPRETPLSPVQLDNMKRAAEAGAIILPAMPGFYHGPKKIGDLVDFVVARICDQLGVANTLIRRWGD
jgi:4-hydroxy-3-polyprenylbenzoate decarboxylase